MFEERRLSKDTVNLALQVQTKFQNPSTSLPLNPSTSLPSSNNTEKKKFVKEECEDGVHNPKATHKEDNCFPIDPHHTLFYFQKKQTKNVTTTDSSKFIDPSKLDNLKTFAVSSSKTSNEIVLDSGALVLMLND
jgi:hypothetical protein